MAVFSRRRGGRTGFTLIEVLVIVAVIGMLVALLIPAVQAVRGVSRRMQCASNLRQVGLAMMNYESVVGSLPLAGNGGRGYSVFSMILFQSEHGNLYNAINFSLDSYAPDNRTAMFAGIAFLNCPSDPAALYPSKSNYVANTGYGYQLNSCHSGTFPIKPVSTPRIQDITDGASNTAAISEIIAFSPGSGSAYTLGDTYRVVQGLVKDQDFDRFVDFCNNRASENNRGTWNEKGLNWLGSALGWTLYNHNAAPNHNSCLNNSLIREGSWPASSYHGGIVNALFADGHARSVKSSIDLRVWRAIGTRAGGEIVNGDF